MLAPLSDSYIGELLGELLGVDSSVGRLSTVVADRVAGIPFCAEEIVRDLAERGEIEGEPGAYVCLREVGDVHVPPTLQAAIGDRIDQAHSLGEADIERRSGHRCPISRRAIGAIARANERDATH